jgi:hypothetical protein
MERAERKIELYRGSEKAASQSMSDAGMQGEAQTVTHAWDLVPLHLPVGAQFTLQAVAADYRPGIGRTPAPRRLTIISADELEARLAELQLQVVRQLGRALALQQNAREEVRRVQAQMNDEAVVKSGVRNALQATELNQRRVHQLLTDPAEGVPSLVATVLEQIEMNRITSTDLRASMGRVLAEIEQLSAGPLGTAERELLAANKSIDEPASTTEGATLSQLLASAGSAQDAVIASLERLIEALSGSADLRQIARELAELRQDQMAHADAARAQIGVETLPLQLSELTSSQRAELNKAAAGQGALARRYEKIARMMENAAERMNEGEDQARAAVEAVELARNLTIGADMNESARDFAENRVGKALARGASIANKLKQIIDALRDQDEVDPAGLVEDLRQAQERLAALRRQTAELREQLSEAEGQGNSASAQQLERLKAQQGALQSDIEQLAAQLDAVQASDAGQSARSAARRLDNQPANANRSPLEPPQPPSSAAARQAEQDLAQAAEQLANRRRQAADDLALEFVRRFQAELGKMVKRQQQVLDDTIEIDALRHPDAHLNDAALQRVGRLADEERSLALLAREHSELLSGLAAVRISLDVAEQRLADAAKLLENRDTGPSAQSAERHALLHLEGMFEAFAQTASEATPNNAAEQPQEAQPTQQPQRRPTFELLEVKMLRMLQADLNERTRQFKAKVEGVSGSPGEDEKFDLTREAGQLQAEQGQLSELVEEMLKRDNEEDGR